MYIDCENQYDLKLGTILKNTEINNKYVIIDYDLCEDTYYSTITCINIEEYNNIKFNNIVNIKENMFKTLLTIDNCNIDEFEFTNDSIFKVNCSKVYNFI